LTRPVRRRPARLRALPLVLVATLVAAGASATAARYWPSSAGAPLAGRPGLAANGAAKSQAIARPKLDRAASSHASVPGPSAASSAAKPAALAPEAAPAAAADVVRRGAAGRSLPRAAAKAASPAPSPATARADHEATLMLEALRTRNSGNAARVGELAEEYRRKHPHGPLQEEALALSVEAAAARRDPNAAALARDYLLRYPRGRFAAQAARVLREAP
jgi:hypothetical protein